MLLGERGKIRKDIIKNEKIAGIATFTSINLALTQERLVWYVMRKEETSTTRRTLSMNLWCNQCGVHVNK